MRYFIVFLLGLIGCNPTNIQPTGTYQKQDNFENWYKLKVYKNNEFEFSGQEGLIGIWTEGSWTQYGDSLILNSFNNNQPSTINSSKSYPKNQLSFYLKDIDGKPIQGAFVKLIRNSYSNEGLTNEYGKITFLKEDYDSLEVGILGYQRLITKMPSSEFNNYDIGLMIDYSAYYQFQNHYFKIFRKRLITDSLPSTNRKQIFKK